MPIGGKLVLKGGVPLKGAAVKKKKHSKKAAAEAGGDSDDEQQQQQHMQQQQEGGQQQDKQPGAPPGEPKKVAATAINVMSGKSYEQEFELEQERIKKPKVKNTPWGSSYREAPEILHGYTSKVTGKTASERLDMRAACKTDKFCK